MKKILIATKNRGKIQEYRDLFHNMEFEVLSLLDFSDSIAPDENGKSFLENALLKAKLAFEQYHIPTLSDDSGLEVFALGNQPGIHSRRYAPSEKDEDNTDLLLQNMKDVSDRRARFVCDIVYIDEAGMIRQFEGTLEGLISRETKGANGFGYDPVFYIPSLSKTLAECTNTEKNSISHRYKAFIAFKESLKGVSYENTSF